MSRHRKAPDTGSWGTLFCCWPSFFSSPPERQGNGASRHVFGDLNKIKPLVNTFREHTTTFCQNTWVNSPWNAHNGILRHLDKWMGSLPVEEQGVSSLCCHGDCKPKHSHPHLTVGKINTDEKWPYFALARILWHSLSPAPPQGNWLIPIAVQHSLGDTTAPEKKPTG